MSYLDSAPGELDGSPDVGVETLMHRAGVGGSLELLLVLGAEGVRHVDFDAQAGDHSWRRGCHFLFYCCSGPGHVKVQRSGHDAHHGEHASAERGSNQVCGREAFAAALIVLGGVGAEFGSRRTVNCFAVQVSLIFKLNGDHPCSFEDAAGRADAGNAPPH